MNPPFSSLHDGDARLSRMRGQRDSFAAGVSRGTRAYDGEASHHRDKFA